MILVPESYKFESCQYHIDRTRLIVWFGLLKKCNFPIVFSMPNKQILYKNFYSWDYKQKNLFSKSNNNSKKGKRSGNVKPRQIDNQEN